MPAFRPARYRNCSWDETACAQVRTLRKGPRLRWPMHTDQLEGINNRIKATKRMAYGDRDSAFLFQTVKAAFPGNPS
jgi:hypothetical protein